MKKILFVLVLVISVLFLLGCTAPNGGATQNPFQKVGGTVCKQDGKPVIRLYSTSFCPHCTWVGPTFESVVKKYVDENKIIAHHWEWIYDNNTPMNQIGADDLLTPQYEGTVPAEEEKVFTDFSPKGSIPTFVFGCKYYRIGNGFEAQKDLNAEEKSFIETIEAVLKEN